MVARDCVGAPPIYRPAASCAPLTASWSARSFSGWPACPFTQNHCTSWGFTASSSRRHRSAFFTGCFADVCHPLLFHLGSHCMIPFRTYVESVYIATTDGRVRLSNATIGAINSMRLLVVTPGSAPYSSFSCLPYLSTAPQPPGPGFPLHAPSVYISTVFATARSLTNPVLGVDACKSGWVAIRLAETVTAHFASTVADLPTDVSVIAIDIPIGLPDRGRRTADVKTRAELGPRWSSIFMTPVRAALAEETHSRASAVNRELAGEGMSIQAFGLFPKIREVDAWRRTVSHRVVEAHPELSFREMAGAPLPDSKKTWAGHEHRRRLLAEQGIHLPADLGNAGREAAPDDILDAAAVAWTAARVTANIARSLPDPPDDYDDCEVAIWR